MAEGPAYFAQLGQDIQSAAASACGSGAAGSDLGNAVAEAPEVMWNAGARQSDAGWVALAFNTCAA